MANDLWETPQYIYDALNNEFHFELDAACNINNCKCPLGLYVEFYDSLKQPWHLLARSIWLNPPYSDPYPWVKKAYEESLNGCTVVCLLPVDTSTEWFHEWVIGKAEIRFMRGRISFDSSTPGKYSAPKFGSMLAIYGPDITPKVIGVKRPDKPKENKKGGVNND